MGIHVFSVALSSSSIVALGADFPKRAVDRFSLSQQKTFFFLLNTQPNGFIEYFYHLRSRHNTIFKKQAKKKKRFGRPQKYTTSKHNIINGLFKRVLMRFSKITAYPVSRFHCHAIAKFSKIHLYSYLI